MGFTRYILRATPLPPLKGNVSNFGEGRRPHPPLAGHLPLKGKAFGLSRGSIAFPFRGNVINLEYDTSSDLVERFATPSATLGHLPLKGKAFGVVYHIVRRKSLEIRVSCLPLQGKVARSAG